MHATQLILLRDLGASFSTAFLLITPVMMLIARGFWPGLLIMVPNVLPETLVFGTMAWLGLRLDVAGILTASVAMGIAVNDTLHFVNWYIRRLSLGDSRDQAIADTLTNCAGAMFHTMLISCCSMLPFLLAEFMPTRQFAYLMIAMLSSALLGDLVLLPAMLMSPLGRCLIPKSRQHASRSQRPIQVLKYIFRLLLVCLPGRDRLILFIHFRLGFLPVKQWTVPIENRNGLSEFPVRLSLEFLSQIRRNCDTFSLTWAVANVMLSGAVAIAKPTSNLVTLHPDDHGRS